MPREAAGGVGSADQGRLECFSPDRFDIGPQVAIVLRSTACAGEDLMRTIWIITAFFSIVLSGLLMNAQVVSAEVELAQLAVMADAACDSSMVIAQAFCTPQNCRGQCQSCGGNIVCVQPGATCCGSSVCAPGRACLPCGGNIVCAESGSSCCGGLVCGPGRQCVPSGGSFVCQ